MKPQVLRQIASFAALLLSTGLPSCDREINPKSEMQIQTGPAHVTELGGTINSFVVVFNELGNKPIEEYGVVYTFDDNVKDRYPDLTDSQVAFDLPPQRYSNEKPVKIEFPSSAHWIGYRAYAKLKSGEIKYAEPVIITY
ncbi:hypothetical protein [Dyadobacter fermentans]|uniref:hypothetical protein n=1 Tax=Dyadobacter fermentans TaxID=94254 RepID=UPI001CBF11AD|nr:hypothetical protein [Dyadobacter fermentans]MBZ1360299.1 hypothetical protein [Dyadobacter fermentans]